ncbi:MAG: hypothetical protein WCI21_09740, partial [Alphaproteobacteria bacterium]
YLLDANGDTRGVGNGGQLEAAFGGQSALGQAFNRPSLTHAVIVMLCWAAVFLAGSFWAFWRQDLEYQG